MNRQLWTISNSLSFFRILLVVPAALFLASDAPADHTLAIGLIVLAILTDFFDGFAARKLNQVTDTGKIIDPLADKIAIGVICVVLFTKGLLPMWFLAAAVTRDLLILSGGLYLKKKKGILLQSNIVGKWTAGVMAMYIFSLVVQPGTASWLNDFLLVASTIMVVISFVLYVRRFARIVAETK